jgi:hypothetical protein
LPDTDNRLLDYLLSEHEGLDSFELMLLDMDQAKRLALLLKARGFGVTTGTYRPTLDVVRFPKKQTPE